MDKKVLISVFGWYGTIAIVVAYALTSFKIITSDTLMYQLLNLTGALGIVFSSLEKKDYQPAVLNLIWLLVALIAVVKILS